MKINSGVVTTKLKESKTFYTRYFKFGVKFEADWFILLESESGDELAFMLPNQKTQHPVFQNAYSGEGMWLTFEVPDVDKEYNRLKKEGMNFLVELKDEEWGDRHFAVQDPNGIGVDVVTHTA